MTYTYSLSLDIKRDCWNWYDSTKDAPPLLHSYENMLYGSGQQMFFDLQKCTSLKAAEKICLPFLKNLYQSQNYYQDNIKSLHAHLHQHFLLACAALEKITHQPLYFHHYPIYLTTFPRLPYSEKEGHFFFSAGDSGQRLIAVFLHEGLHLQFHHYYAQTPSLLQAKFTNEAWHALKECLTGVARGVRGAGVGLRLDDDARGGPFRRPMDQNLARAGPDVPAPRAGGAPW